MLLRILRRILAPVLQIPLPCLYFPSIHVSSLLFIHSSLYIIPYHFQKISHFWKSIWLSDSFLMPLVYGFKIINMNSHISSSFFFFPPSLLLLFWQWESKASVYYSAYRFWLVASVPSLCHVNPQQSSLCPLYLSQALGCFLPAAVAFISLDRTQFGAEPVVQRSWGASVTPLHTIACYLIDTVAIDTYFLVADRWSKENLATLRSDS